MKSSLVAFSHTVWRCSSRFGLEYAEMNVCKYAKMNVFKNQQRKKVCISGSMQVCRMLVTREGSLARGAHIVPISRAAL